MQLKHFTLVALAGIASGQSLTEALGGNQDLSLLAGLIGSLPQEVQGALTSASNVTILAPSNSALQSVLNTTAGMMLSNDSSLLTGLLQYHILNGTFPADQIPESMTFVPTLLTNEDYSLVTGGQRVGVQRQDDAVTIFSGAGMNSSVTTPDVDFTGGVIHVIDTVLTLPMTASSTAVAANLTALVGAVSALNLTETIDTTPDVTIFAPIDMAFEAIANAIANLTTDQLTSILSYHVVEGTVGYSSMLMDDMKIPALAGGDLTINIEDDAVFVNNARVIMPNVLVKNGVVHVIDNVLSPNATQTDQGPIVPSATGSDVPFTSMVPTMTTGGAGGDEASSTATPESTGGAATMPTGAVGIAALFGAAAVGVLNY